jgi:serine/threonine protein kinase
MRVHTDEAKQTFQTASNHILHRWTELVRNEEARALQYASESRPSTSSSGNDDATQYIVLRRLGCGSEGCVDEVREVSTGSVYARKQVLFGRNPSDKSTIERKVRNEVDIMKKLKHPHCARVCYWRMTSGSCDIYMELVANVNLSGFLERCTLNGYDPAELNVMISWVGCLVNALAFAHCFRVVHQDIKPSNILIQGEQVFLADFGESKDFSDREISNTNNADVCGTPIYRAPEVAPGHPRSYPADVFSLGCVFSEMVTVCAGRSIEDYRKARYNKDSETPRAFRTNLIRVREWIHELKCDEHLEDSLQNSIIPQTLREDPSKRKTAQQLSESLKHFNFREDVCLYCTSH